LGVAAHGASQEEDIQVDQIKIGVRVPLAAAVAAGRAEYGDGEVALTPEQVSALSAEARSVLTSGELESARRASDPVILPANYWPHYNGGTLRGERLSIADTAPATVIAALEARAVASAAARAEHEAEKLAKYERKIGEALAQPDEDWIGGTGERRYYTREGDTLSHDRRGYVHQELGILSSPSSVYLADEYLIDPRIVERRARIEREVLPVSRRSWEARYAEWSALVAATEARQAAEQAELEARRGVCAAAIRTLAGTYDDLARPAAEGYDVTRAVLDRLADRLAESSQCEEVSVDTTEWRDPVDRAAPSPEAFALLDRVTAAARTANETVPAAIGRWVVSRIVRVDTCPHAGEAHKITAVLATLDTLVGVRQITFSLESQDCGHEHE
jgi:hypothetical protein